MFSTYIFPFSATETRVQRGQSKHENQNLTPANGAMTNAEQQVGAQPVTQSVLVAVKDTIEAT